MDRRPITSGDLFALHQAVMPLSAVDALTPMGDWKNEFNGTTGAVNGKSVYMEYAASGDVPGLMERWLADFNKTKRFERPDQAVAAYVHAHLVFVRIHPLFDGYGRMARLIANLPVLGRRLFSDPRPDVALGRILRPPLALPKPRRAHWTREPLPAPTPFPSRI
mgnify:FL=1|jgi:Fic family protein